MQLMFVLHQVLFCHNPSEKGTQTLHVSFKILFIRAHTTERPLRIILNPSRCRNPKLRSIGQTSNPCTASHADPICRNRYPISVV